MSPRRSRSGLAVGRERRHPGRGNRPNAGPVGVRRRLGMEPPHTLKCVQSGARRYGIRSLRIGDQCLPTAGGWDSERHGRERLVYGLVCPTRYGSRSLWEAKRMSSGPAHPGILVGVDGFAVIKGCCAVSRARGKVRNVPLTPVHVVCTPAVSSSALSWQTVRILRPLRRLRGGRCSPATWNR